MKANIADVYRNKRILITGHTGFKGAWLTMWLHHLGAELIGVSLDPLHSNSFFNVCKTYQLIKDYRVDIRDYNSVRKIFEEESPEIIIHMAAQPLVLESYKHPLYTYETNAIGTANILEAIRTSKSVKKALFVTTDKVYENKEFVWGYRENDSLGGFEPYGTSKAAAEMIIAGYRCSYFNPEKFSEHGVSIITVRAGNVIGGGDWSENRIIPDCVRSLMNDEPIMVRNPKAIRPWQHVLEALGGYLAILMKDIATPGHFSESFNIGPGLKGLVDVKTLVDKVILYWGSGSFYTPQNSKQPYESGILALDISKAKLKLGWEPILDFDTTLKWTIDWYKSLFNGEDILGLSINQIKTYQSLLDKLCIHGNC